MMHIAFTFRHTRMQYILLNMVWCISLTFASPPSEGCNRCVNFEFRYGICKELLRRQAKTCVKDTASIIIICLDNPVVIVVAKIIPGLVMLKIYWWKQLPLVFVQLPQSWIFFQSQPDQLASVCHVSQNWLLGLCHPLIWSIWGVILNCN